VKFEWSIEKSASKKKFLMMNSRRTAIDSSTNYTGSTSRVFKTRFFDQVGLQFSPEAFCFLEGVNDESFLSFNELFCCPNFLFEDLQPFVQGRQFSSAVRGVISCRGRG
jgi:hypothetical protein